MKGLCVWGRGLPVRSVSAPDSARCDVGPSPSRLLIGSALRVEGGGGGVGGCLVTCRGPVVTEKKK